MVDKYMTLLFLMVDKYMTLFSFSLFFWLCCAACWILVPWPGIEPWPWHWKHRVLTTGPPGYSCMIHFFKKGPRFYIIKGYHARWNVGSVLMWHCRWFRLESVSMLSKPSLLWLGQFLCSFPNISPNFCLWVFGSPIKNAFSFPLGLPHDILHCSIGSHPHYSNP